MTLVPDFSTFKLLPPVYDEGARLNARMFVDLYEESSSSHTRYDKDSRGIVNRALDELSTFGFTHAMWGPEIEFFIFDKINIYPSSIGAIQSYGGSGYSIESKEAPWTRGNLSTRIDLKEGYYPAQPRDTLDGLRKDICDDLHKYFETQVEAQHHEVATSGQCEINLVYDETLRMADAIITLKNLVKVKSKRKGKIATFMPKPFYGDNSSAMHVHQSLWSGEKNVMYDPNDKESVLAVLLRNIGQSD